MPAPGICHVPKGATVPTFRDGQIDDGGRVLLSAIKEPSAVEIAQLCLRGAERVGR